MMDVLMQIQGLLIGLIGWAATAMMIVGSSRLNVNEQRAMIVCSWALWMIPAMGSLVYRGVISTDTAVIACGTSTIILAVMASLSAIRWRTRP